MAGFFGGDTEQMRSHATACEQGARRIQDLTDLTSVLVDSVEWVGPDGDAFRARWHGMVKASMVAKADEIRVRADEIDQHAEEQDQASGGDGGGGFWDGVRDLVRDIFTPGGPGGPIIGLPITPNLMGQLQDGLGNWFTGGGATGPQEFYGDNGYGDRGHVVGDDRPVGTLLDFGGDLLSGREIDEDFGYLDVSAQGQWNAGAHGTTDPYGNMTGTIGAQGGMELGLDQRLNGPFGTGIETSTQVGVEAYAEAGGTIGPDGFAAGAQAGSGLYASNSVTLDGGDHGSVSYGQEAFVGADASANLWSHATRNEDGNVNGWTFGADASAFAGGELNHTFAAEAPGGWAFVSGSAAGLGGGGAGGGAGATVSTDELSISLDGKIAKGLGLGASGTIGVNPNAIVESITPGDYNLDDAIGDAGAFVSDGADWVADKWPF